MSFGNKEYQHRYFKESGNSKPTMSRISNNSPIPNAYQRYSQSLDPVYYVPARRENRILHNDSLQPYLPPLTAGYNDYVYNSIVLDNFKRNADNYRKYKRFGTLNDYYEGLPPVRRVVTEAPLVQTVVPSTPSIVYINKDNPQMLANLHNYNTILASRMSQVEREKEKMHNEVIKEKQLVRQYRRKYDKLKYKLKEEVNKRRMREVESRQRRDFQLEKEKDKMDEIEYAMLEMSQQLNNNSKIIGQNLKLKEELYSNELQKSKNLNVSNIPIVLTPSTLFERAEMDAQYKEMQRLKKQIKQLDKKLGYSSKY